MIAIYYYSQVKILNHDIYEDSLNESVEIRPAEIFPVRRKRLVLESAGGSGQKSLGDYFRAGRVRSRRAS